MHPERTAGGHREYDEVAIDRIRLILRLRSAGLDMRSVRMSLSYVDAEVISSEAIELLRADKGQLTDHIEAANRTLGRLDELIASAMSCTTEQQVAPGDR